MSATAFDINFGGTTIDGVDKSIGNPPDGYYRTKVAKVDLDQEHGRLRFEFEITHGIHAGRRLKGSLGNPRLSDSPEKSMARARAWAVRLGLAKKEDENKTVSMDFAAAVGKPIVVKVATKKGDTGSWQEVGYCDLWPLEHPDLDGPTRHSLGLQLLPGQSATESPKGRGKGNAVTPGTASGAPANAQSPDAVAAALFG
jgi:hypothetical protein